MNFNQDIDYLFMFCKKCWEYRKFVFDQPLRFDNLSKNQIGQCSVCHNSQIVSSVEIKEYYDHLNDHNQ